MKEVFKYILLALSAILTIGTLVEDCGGEDAPEPIESNGYHKFDRKFGHYTLTRQTDTCGKYPNVKEEINISWREGSSKLDINYSKLAWACVDNSIVITLPNGKTVGKIAEPRKYTSCRLGGKIYNHIQNTINELSTFQMKNIDKKTKGKYIYTVSAANTAYHQPFLEWSSDEDWKGFNYLKWRLDTCK